MKKYIFDPADHGERLKVTVVGKTKDFAAGVKLAVDSEKTGDRTIESLSNPAKITLDRDNDYSGKIWVVFTGDTTIRIRARVDRDGQADEVYTKYYSGKKGDRKTVMFIIEDVV